MKTEITITKDQDMLMTRKKSSFNCKQPTVIDDICELLHDYLKGLG